MMPRLAALILILLLSASVAAQTPKELVGKYQMEVQDGDILELRVDGTASMAGEETRWSAKNNQLSVGTDVMRYTLQGDRLLMTLGTMQLSWKRIDGTGKGSSLMQRAAGKMKPSPPANPDRNETVGGNSQDAQARQILTSSAWCSFTYNKVSGTSTTRRVAFRSNGMMIINGGAETYSSGSAGTYGGQSSNSESMQWRLENLRLYVDAGDGSGFQDIGLEATKNSNGSLILHAGGREYSMCQ